MVQIPAEILESYYVAGLIKVAANRLLGRRRPNEELGPRYFELNGGSSFPSGHAANVSQVATILSRHIDFLPFTIAAYTAVGTVCVQRLTSESHWPSDVYFAVVYGWAVSNEIFRLNRERRLNLQPAALGADNIPGLMISFKF
ncbi:MAG: phosphatase PAP2 family protein [candidate division Zixibacteria bacterium]|nr:phosphatase PAP2 family protein [candidate division Zixibacteria bacterium]